MSTVGSPSRGQGSILGAAFILLILLTSYTFYTLHVEVTNGYMKTLQDMQLLDLKRSKENIEFISVSFTSQDELNVTAKNTGSYQVHLIWLGIFDDDTNTQDYYKINFYIDPTETESDIRNDTIPTFEGQERVIQIVTELGNIFSYSYPEAAEDDAQASITITGIKSTAVYNPSEWNLLGSTEYVSGSVSDLASNDANYTVFRSYYNGTMGVRDITDFVDNNTSDVDNSTDNGIHSDFSAQQAGPDSVCDTLTEGNTGTGATNTTLINQESFEGTWPPTGWTETGRWNKESDQAYDGTYSADFDGSSGMSQGVLTTPDLDSSDVNAIYVDFWYRDGGCESNEFLLQYYDGTSWDTVADLGSTTSEGQWLHYQEKVTDSQYFKSTFKIRWSASTNYWNDVAYVDFVTVKKEADNINYELDLEVQWTNVDYDEANEELAIYLAEGNTHSLDAAGGYMVIGDGMVDWGSARGTISFWIKWDSVANRPWGQHGDMETRISGSNLVLDWGGDSSITSSTSFTSGRWYFIAIAWDETTDDLYLYVGDEDNAPSEDTHNAFWTGTVSDEGVTQNNFLASRGGYQATDGHGDDLRYWDTDRTLAQIQSDYKTELTGSESNLKSYFKLNNNFDDLGSDNNDGSGSGSYSFSTDVPFDAYSTENIHVDVWNGASWQDNITELTIGWNNVSVSAYLDSPIFTIRFQGGTETGDTAQNRWHIDVSLLHLWTDVDEYVAEVDFIGSSNLEDWTRIDWQIDSCWNIGEVTVTGQFYDYSIGDYVTGGNGYFNYVSESVGDTDELKSKIINVNPTNFRNSTGHWRVKIKGVKSTGIQFLMKIDWIEFNPKYPISGDSIPYDTRQEYSIKATTTGGDPIPYAYISIYANGTNLAFRNALTKESASNPCWVYLNAEGEYNLEIKSTNGSTETFVLYVVAGSVVGQKTITQEEPE